MNKKRILGAITLASVLVFQKCQSLLKMIKKQLMAGH